MGPYRPWPVAIAAAKLTQSLAITNRIPVGLVMPTPGGWRSLESDEDRNDYAVLSQASHQGVCQNSLSGLFAKYGFRLAQLEEFDQATRDLMQERQESSFGGRDDDANLVSLAHRLKPAGAKPTSVGNFDD
jgi:hypothetical protein